MINKFLAGKKKYSVFITTLVVAAIEMFVADPGAQKELMDFVPLLAMLGSGIVYLIIEGINDLQREKTSTVKASTGMPLGGPGVPQNSGAGENTGNSYPKGAKP